MTKTAFAILLDETGLTIRWAAAFLGVLPKQVRLWCHRSSFTIKTI